MLRITRLLERHELLRLKVEGRLVGDSVEVLELELTQALAQATALTLDLSGVEFADARALSFLHGVSRRGIELLACSPLLTSLLENQSS